MPLKTIVKVGSITNLSDARYCSGMGVDMLGFRVVEGDANYLSPKHFQEIRGWVVGPQIVAEVYGIRDNSALSQILSDYRPDYLELGKEDLHRLGSSLPIPYILSLKPEDSTPVTSTADFVLLSTFQESTALSVPVLLHVREKQLLESALSSQKIKGIALDGSHEIKPGLKDYEALAEILEALESED